VFFLAKKKSVLALSLGSINEFTCPNEFDLQQQRKLDWACVFISFSSFVTTYTPIVQFSTNQIVFLNH
jgi:hypothetical protein